MPFDRHKLRAVMHQALVECKRAEAEKQASVPIMPFGKYKGQPLPECDTRYLDWIIAQDWMQGSQWHELRSAIINDLQRRIDEQPHMM
jgi:uncharacterized protein (DUF3820 family)